MTTHAHLSPRLKKEYRYTPTPFVAYSRVNFTFIGWYFLLDHERQPDAIVCLPDSLKVVITTIFRLPPVADRQTPLPDTRPTASRWRSDWQSVQPALTGQTGRETPYTFDLMFPDMQQTIVLFDISHLSPAYPYDKSSIKVKLHWWNYTEMGKNVNTGSKLYSCATFFTTNPAWPGLG